MCIAGGHRVDRAGTGAGRAGCARPLVALRRQPVEPPTATSVRRWATKPSASRSTRPCAGRSTASTCSSTAPRHGGQGQHAGRRSTPACPWSSAPRDSRRRTSTTVDARRPSSVRSRVVSFGELLADCGRCSQAAALLAARHLPQWEVIDYASADEARRSQRDRARAGRATRRGPRRRSSDTRSRTSTALRRHAARTSAARRSIRCASRASSCPPKWSSACPTSA